MPVLDSLAVLPFAEWPCLCVTSVVGWVRSLSLTKERDALQKHIKEQAEQSERTIREVENERRLAVNAKAELQIRLNRAEEVGVHPAGQAVW